MRTDLGWATHFINHLLVLRARSTGSSPQSLQRRVNGEEMLFTNSNTDDLIHRQHRYSVQRFGHLSVMVMCIAVQLKD